MVQDETWMARIAELDRRTVRLESRIRALEAGREPEFDRAPRLPVLPPSPPARRAWRPSVSVSDLVGRRLLGWLGGTAMLIGIGLFLALAVSHGWIGPEGRVLLAGATSLTLMALGVWLYERHGRTEAAAIVVGVATAGQWGTLAVAVDLYRLVAPLPAVALALASATAATLLALRWAGRPLAALALIGGLLAPLALGVADHTAAIAILGVAGAGVLTVCTRQRWHWIAAGALGACIPQWWAWLAQGQPAALQLVVIGWFTALGLAAAVCSARRAAVTSAVGTLAVLSTAGVGIGALSLWGTSGPQVGATFLAVTAVGFALCGRGGPRRLRAPEPLDGLLSGAALVLVDGALALMLSGVWLTAAWGASALAAAWLVRRDAQGTLAQVGLGGQVALTLTRALQASVGAGHGDVMAVLSLSILAGSCLVSGGAIGRRAQRWTIVLNILGLVATAYLTAQTLTGPMLVVAWCVEAAVLGELSRRAHDRIAGAGALGFLGLAGLHVCAFEAPPTALVIGVPDLLAAATALGAIAAVTLRAGLAPADPRARLPLLAACAGAGLYLVSVAVITAFQPVAGAVSDAVLDLGVRQQGQVLLSGLWSVLGVAVLVFGLRRNQAAVRTVGLGILLVAVGKVFLYDLSTLTSIYRVLSLVALGALCLGGAFAYQRLRPGPLADLRATAP